MKPDGAKRFAVLPMTFRQGSAFVARHHRHHRPPRGCKFVIGAIDDSCGTLHGVAMVGRPIARSWDDGLTLEVNRTCTDGTPNANSFLYGACWRIARAMGYRKLITYTQVGESGASLRAAGYRIIAERPARPNWREATTNERLRLMRDFEGSGGVARTAWEIVG